MTITATTIYSHDQWQQLRSQDVTASVVGALFGVHPYMTVGKLQVEKVEGVSFARADSAVIRRGHALEKIVAEEVFRKFGEECAITKATEYFRDVDARLGATPDYWITMEGKPGRGILQCKTVGSLAFRRAWDDEKVIPFWVSLQAITEMMLTDSKWGMVAVLVIGDFEFGLNTYFCERHPGAEQRIRTAAIEFWTAIDEGREPRIDYARDGELLKALYPREVTDKTLDLSGDNRILDLLESRESFRVSVKKLEDGLTEIDNEIRHKMGDAELATARGWLLTNRTHHRKERLMPASEYRVLRVKREIQQEDKT